jgi:DNA-binding NtrC family response regulator
VSASVRSDLVGRLGAEPIVIPALRDRVEDIGALVAHFGGRAVAGMEPTAFRALCLYDWPRNVRELEGVVTRAIALADGRPLRLEHLPGVVRDALEAGPRVSAPRKHRAAPPREELQRLLYENQGNVSAVARALKRRWLVVRRWLRQHGLDAARFRR